MIEPVRDGAEEDGGGGSDRAERRCQPTGFDDVEVELRPDRRQGRRQFADMRGGDHAREQGDRDDNPAIARSAPEAHAADGYPRPRACATPADRRARPAKV
jgi:hypothetical protein